MGKVALGCVAVLVLVGLVVGVAALGSYNNLVSMAQATDAQWANVETAYQRRADLIPSLVKTVQGAADFERSTLIAVTEARASVGRLQQGAAPTDPEALAKWQAAQDQLSGALSRLMVVVESYPDLKANASFRDLQAQLEGTENRISVERRKFNDAAKEYNTARQRFPAVLMANAMGFHEKPYFRSAPGADAAPQVDFHFGPSPAAP